MRINLKIARVGLAEKQVQYKGLTLSLFIFSCSHDSDVKIYFIEVALFIKEYREIQSNIISEIHLDTPQKICLAQWSQWNKINYLFLYWCRVYFTYYKELVYKPIALFTRQGNVGLKLQNSQKFPHIHARFHCNANEQS